MACGPSTVQHASAFEEKSEWTLFLENYAKGDWPKAGCKLTEGTPPICTPTGSVGEPLTSVCSVTSESENDDNLPLEAYEKHLYPSVGITDDSAEAVRQFVQNQEYLPPPRSPLEHRRLACIEQYDINSAEQITNIQQAVNVVGAFFPQAIITYTQFEGKTPMYLAAGGNQELIERFGITTNEPVSPYTAICGHTVLLKNDLMHIPDLKADFRFRANPATQAGARSYIGSPVFLPLVPLPGVATEEVESVGVGALNVLFIDEAHEVLTANEAMVVRQLAKHLESQMRSTWDGVHRSAELRKRAIVADMIETTFVEEQKQRQEESATPTADAVRLLRNKDEEFSALAHRAVERLATTLDKLSGITLLNIGVAFDEEGAEDQPHICKLVAQQSKETWNVPKTLPSAILTRTSSLAHFSKATSPSGLELSLPSDTASHLVMPFFSSDRPQFVIIATSRRSAIAPTDITFVRTVGSILLARRVQDLAIAADYAKTTFLSTMSHEIRTPLHSLVSSATLAAAAADVQDWNEVKAFVDSVRSSGLTLQTVVNDILDFGQPTNNEARDVKTVTETDIVALVKEASSLALTQYQDQQPGFALRLRLQQGRSDWRALVSHKGYPRVFLNGLTNALKFCKNGPIEIYLSRDGRKLVTTIDDKGVGLDEDELDYLTSQYTKASDHTPGAGLGLHIVRRLTREMGGEFKIKSDKNRGTTFRFTIPDAFPPESESAPATTADSVAELFSGLTTNTVRDPTPSPPIAPPQQPGDSAQVAPKTTPDPLRVLVVDDNMVCRRILTKLLKRCPASIKTAEADDGSTALDVFPDFAPHLVLTDVSMPIMDGVTSAQHMRRIAVERQMPPSKIYAITGLGLSDPRLKAAGLRGTADLDGWLVKGQDDLAAITRIVAELWEVETAKLQTAS